MDNKKLDDAFETLKTYDWGKDPATLQPIDDAVAASYGDAEARKAIEARLIESLKTSTLRSAHDYICRKLMTVGTAAAVPALASFLADKDRSHMARYALERIQAEEAEVALREALPKVAGPLKVGVLGSLGARRAAASVPAIVASLEDSDPQVAKAAACALGDIASPEAANALLGALEKSPEATAVTDACLVCAERLLDGGKKADAVAMYKAIDKSAKSKQVRMAAKRGLLDALKKK